MTGQAQIMDAINKVNHGTGIEEAGPGMTDHLLKDTVFSV
jgi:hypothetical protein